ncbi:MAG TPA: FTR1 family protein [Gemmatimonadaceae bacterium]|nr:FTR1 family protein [Gemmatimonadaceae bacterium]
MRSQDTAARRLASIVSVAVSEYGLAVDKRGQLISAEEYTEVSGFLENAREVAGRLEGRDAPAARAALQELIGAVKQKRPPAALEQYRASLLAALGEAAQLELPSAPLDTAVGRQIFTESCASCHGSRGLGDGPVARTLTTRVPAIGSAAGTPNLTPTLAYNVTSVGINGTAMPPFGESLTPQQRWEVVNYVYQLRGQPMPLPSQVAAVGGGASSTTASIVALLDSSLASARRGSVATASDGAFDAYLAFEPLETVVRAKDPRLVASLERSFGEFRVAVRGGDTGAATRARNAIADALPRAVALANGTDEGAVTMFWQSFIIILREGFEAILVVGAVVAFLIKTGNRKRLRSIWIGAALGVVASAITAVILKTALAAIPASSEIVEAVSLLVAVVVLFSVSYWLISKVEAHKWQKFIREKVSLALETGSGGALMLIAFLAVYREGAETALFYQALFSQAHGAALPLTLGIVAGSVALGVVFVLFYRFGVKIPMRTFFAATSLLLYYMAFVFAGRGIRELQEGNVLPMTPLAHVPDISWLGLFPTVETTALQSVLLVLFAFAIVKTFVFTTAPDPSRK